MSPSTPRSLAATIRQFTSAELAHLLRSRPDLASPRPMDLSELIERATSRASTLRALRGLNAWQLAVARGLAAWENGDKPVEIPALAKALGGQASPQHVQTAINELCSIGLAWDQPVHLAQAARAAFGDHPHGLAAQSTTPLTDAEINEALELVGAEGRNVLDRLLWGPPTGAVQRADRAVNPSTAETTMDKLLATGLLRPIGPDQVILPREVALVLREGRFTAQPTPATEPPWPSSISGAGASLPTDLITRAAIGSAQELISHVVTVLDDIAARTPRALASGKISKRDQAAFARLVGDDDIADFVVHLASQAGLFTIRGGAVLPTTAMDDFLDMDLFHRWGFLRHHWTGLEWWPESVRDAVPAEQASAGGADRLAAADHHGDGGSPNLGGPSHQGHPSTTRQAALEELAGSAPGTGVDAEALAARLSWRHPALAPEGSGAINSQQMIAELEWLGMLAFSRISELAAVADDAADPGFSSYGSHLVLQSDLTAVAPAPLDHTTAALLGVMAHRESHGATATYRFTEKSLVKALDAGWSAPEILDWLAAHNEQPNDALADAPLPDALVALVNDVARQHGKVRVMTVTAVVTFDDPGTQASVLADQRASDLGLIELAPGVIGAGVDPAELVAFLRARGLAPVAQGNQGIRITTPPGRRAPARVEPAAEARVDVDALSAALLRRESVGLSSEQVVQALTTAYRDDLWVEVDWADDNGAPHRHRMRVLSIASGIAHLVRHAAGRLSLPLSRIIAVELPTPDHDFPGTSQSNS